MVLQLSICIRPLSSSKKLVECVSCKITRLVQKCASQQLCVVGKLLKFSGIWSKTSRCVFFFYLSLFDTLSLHIIKYKSQRREARTNCIAIGNNLDCKCESIQKCCVRSVGVRAWDLPHSSSEVSVKPTNKQVIKRTPASELSLAWWVTCRSSPLLFTKKRCKGLEVSTACSTHKGWWLSTNVSVNTVSRRCN